MKHLICRIFGHRLFVVKRYSYTMRKVKCRRCGGVFGVEDCTQSFVPWDGELEEVGDVLLGVKP